VLRAGVGGVTRAALFKPLAENNIDEINGIMSATRIYMQKIGLIIAGGVIAFSFIYPFMVVDEYAWWYSCLMVLVLGAGTFAENFFGIKNMLLLQADQKMYIQNIAGIIAYLGSFLISVVLILCQCDMLVVKVGTLFTFLLKPLFLEIYVRKHYKINMKVPPNNLALKNRWHAFAQQLAIIINGNIDVVLITMFSVLGEVSVYTVHCMVVNNISKVVQAPVNGVGPTFGNMLATGERDNLRSAFSFIEWGLFAFTTLIFAVTAFMITPFISLYTYSVTDINYYQPLFAFLLVVAMMLNTLRIPYQAITEAAGHFKQTRNGSILEVIVHVAVSGILLIKLGIIGVVIGALVSSVIRTIQYSVYSMKNILEMSVWHIIKNYIVYFACFIVCFSICKILPFKIPSSYGEWCLVAVAVTALSFVIVAAVSLIFNMKDVKYLYRRISKKKKK
jgi:O-antigen/teichoic acid export membrane protein